MGLICAFPAALASVGLKKTGSAGHKTTLVMSPSCWDKGFCKFSPFSQGVFASISLCEASTNLSHAIQKRECHQGDGQCQPIVCKRENFTKGHWSKHSYKKEYFHSCRPQGILVFQENALLHTHAHTKTTVYLSEKDEGLSQLCWDFNMWVKTVSEFQIWSWLLSYKNVLYHSMPAALADSLISGNPQFTETRTCNRDYRLLLIMRTF